jgi:DNA-binding LacI/PurR family transcriptional regulator
MARHLGIGVRFMQEAVTEMERRGTLTVRRNSGIWCGKRPAQPPALQGRCEEMRRRIEGDIVTGKLRTGELPVTMGDLRRRYGASQFLIRKALQVLLERGLLRREGHRLYCADPAFSQVRKQHASVMLLGVSDESGRIAIMDLRFAAFITALESERAAQGIGLDHGAVRTAGTQSDALIKRLISENRHIGYIIWSNGIPGSLLETIISHLARIGKPVAVIDEIGTVTFRDELARLPLVKVFTIAAFKAGMAMGAHMLSAGHRRIDYCSVDHDQAWSQRRLQGLVKAYATAGIADAVTPRVAVGIIDTVTVPAPARRHMERFLKVMQQGINREHVWFSNISRRHINRYTIEILEKQRIALQRLLGSLDVRSAPNAIVFGNDMTAVIGIDVLESRGISPANRIAIAGFDDIDIAYQYNLTSYNFNLPAIAQTSLGFIVHPRHERFRSEGPIECDGMVIVRQSSGEKWKARNDRCMVRECRC